MEENKNKLSYKAALDDCYDSTLDQINAFALAALMIFQQVLKEKKKTSYADGICSIAKLIIGLNEDWTTIKAERLSKVFVHKPIEQNISNPAELDVLKKDNESLEQQLIEQVKPLFALQFDEKEYGPFTAFKQLQYIADESLGMMVFTAKLGCYILQLETIAHAEQTIMVK